MLLALRDEKGTPALGSMHAYALGGAILAELLLAGRITVDEGKRKLVNLVSDEPLGDPVIDECLQKIANAKRRAVTRNWVQTFAMLRRLHHRVAEGLCDRGILREDQDKVLLIFSRKIYPEVNPAPERQLIERLRRAIFAGNPRVDPRTAILISLTKSTNLLNGIFEKRELKKQKKRIEQLASGDLMGKATGDAIQAAQAAIIAACIIPAVITTTTTT